MEASVPVFGNCCLDLPADSDGVSDDNVSADADALVDADADVLADADSETDVLADADTLVDVDSEALVLADTDALVDVDSEGDVLGFVTSFSVLVKSTPGMTAVLPDGVVTVALPLLSTTTVEPGLTALTLSSITFFSSGVKAFGSDTTVLSAGLTISLPAFGFVTSFSVLVKSTPGMTAVLPDGVVTVALPLLSTTTVEPGLTALTLSSITFFSSGVKAFGSDTTVLSAGLTISLPAFGFVTSFSVLVKSTPGMTAVLPDGVVTVALPLLSTTTVEPGLTALTLSSITFFSSGVKAFGSDTTVLSAGVFIEVLVEIDVLPPVEVDALVLAEADALVLAEADALVLAEAEALVDAEADALVLAEADALVDAEADALVDAEAEALVDAEADALVLAEAEALVLAEADALVDAEADALVLAEADALVLAEAEALVDAEADALVDAEADALVDAEADALVDAD